MIDRHDARAWYQQIADDLRDGIERGVHPPGAALPSEGELARHYVVGRDVIRKALAVLRQEGLVAGARGRRTTVRPRVQRREVVLRTGDQLVSRMPTDHERVRRDMDHGVPVLEITRRDGTIEHFTADRVFITGGTVATECTTA